MRLIRHEEPAVVTAVPPYAPTYGFPGPFIGESHAFYAGCPLRAREDEKHLVDLGIDGWLRREDALKLYELAYFAGGPVLELGSYRGLSTTILARALKDAGRGNPLVSVELDPAALAGAREALAARGLLEGVRLVEGDAAAFCRAEAERGARYAFVFVDHDHAYKSVLDVCVTFGRLVAPGGFCLFHDYLDARNYDPGNREYGVFQAVRDGLPRGEFEQWGVFGVTGLYRRKPAPLWKRLLGG